MTRQLAAGSCVTLTRFPRRQLGVDFMEKPLPSPAKIPDEPDYSARVVTAERLRRQNPSAATPTSSEVSDAGSGTAATETTSELRSKNVSMFTTALRVKF